MGLAMSGNVEVARVLLASAIDVEAKMKRALGSGRPPQELYQDVTPLHLATMEGHAGIVQMLLEHGADRTARLRLAETRGGRRTDRVMTALQAAKEMALK